jgi:hypothetical protein
MLRNSQLSHILLLVVIGFAIYYLTSPKKTIKNTGTVDDVASDENMSEENEVEDEIENEVENVLKRVAQENNAREEIEERDEIEEREERGIVSEVEEELKMNESEPEEERGESQPHSFKPTETDGGANLQNAFGRPVPEGTDINSVDFNKNYLKKYDSKNYLPKEVNDEWFDTDFTQAKNKLDNDKLINTEKYVIGVDTVGQSLKNASHDIRGTIANPKFNVSPWNNSTYEPDNNIKALC